MQCPECKYISNDSYELCPRCGFDMVNDIADASLSQDLKTTTAPAPEQPPAVYPFPADGHAMITRNEMQYGPYTLGEINAYIKSGNLVQSDKLLTDAGEWTPLNKVQDVIIPAPTPTSTPSTQSTPTSTYGDLFPASYEGTIPYRDVRTDNTESATTKQENRTAMALSIIGFLLPIVGLVIWMTLTNKESPMAEQVGRWTFYGLIFNLTFFAFMVLV